MQLAIGDVVRDRGDMALATVAGMATNAEGNLVALQLSGGGVRLTAPYDLDLVARHSRPPSAAHTVVSVLVLVVALAAAVIGWRSAQELGAGWPLAVLTGLGCCTAVKLAYDSWDRLTGPRRFRV
ncbi:MULTISPECIES: hypothetical protein [unclassified Streptomyces]|uniref:hypothetical protein n=1 Tax=unclassified Streptomyces TaxID=2593676 RepID=UPI0024A8843D|nr:MULTISPECIES: hypothetical protein [unclassified Streptomyces]